jgi:hypothetical protein
MFVYPRNVAMANTDDALSVPISSFGQILDIATLRDPLILYFAMLGKLFGMRQARA